MTEVQIKQEHAAHGAPHAPADPGAAPMHHDLHERFTMGQMMLAWVLGGGAIIAGIILGLTVVNN